MTIKITFLGAARNVTGSRYLVEADSVRFLVDCGLYQEREFRERDWAPFTPAPQSLDGMVLTHAHLDHCGLLPKLVREGFNHPIYCTSATAEIAPIVLLDSAALLQQDAEYKSKRHEREGRQGPYPEIPLYTVEEAKACTPLFTPLKYGEPLRLGNSVEISLHDAGHVLGSAMIQVKARDGGETRTVIFSGDIGRRNKPILNDPTVFSAADYVVMESTYGDRVHEPTGAMLEELVEVVNTTVRAGGNIVIPSFALERAQEIIFYLNKFLIADKIPHLMVLMDSPMAVNITEVFQHHPELLDEETLRLIKTGQSPFDFPGLKMIRSIDESKAINYIKGSVVIIAGSGMCTGGRIKHHLVTNITRPESTILFVGYQAAGTLGRQIVDGIKEVRILGKQYPVRARITQMNGFSGHADRDELLLWLTGLKKAPRRVFITHGEPGASQSLANLVTENLGWPTTVPEYQQEITLD